MTLAPVLTRAHGRLDFTRPAAELACRVRGFTPWPGTHTSLAGRVLKVHRAAPVAGGAEPGPPGTTTVVDGSLRVACGGDTALELLEVQPEGKRRMAARDFVNGLPAGGLVLGT